MSGTFETFFTLSEQDKQDVFEASGESTRYIARLCGKGLLGLSRPRCALQPAA